MAINISVIGTVASDPAVHQFDNGLKKCQFRLAVNERKRDRNTGDWVDAPTQWFTINSFRTLAENAGESIEKGQRVVVSGRLQIKNWESGGKKGSSLEIDAEGLGHDLRWGRTFFEKTTGSRDIVDIQSARSFYDDSEGAYIRKAA